MAGWKKVLLTNSEITADSDALSNKQHTWDDLSPVAIDYGAADGSKVTKPADLTTLLNNLSIDGTTEPAVLRVDASGNVGWGKGAPSNVIVGEIADGTATELTNGVVPMATTLVVGDNASYSVMDSPISATVDSATVAGTFNTTDLATLKSLSVTAEASVVGTLGVAGIATFDVGSVHSGGITTGGNIIPGIDSTHNLGSSSGRFANVYTESIGDSEQPLGVGATILSFNAIDNAACTIDTSGDNALTISSGTATTTMTAGTVAIGTNATVGGTLGVTGVSTLATTNITGASGASGVNTGYIVGTNIGYTTNDNWTSNTQTPIDMGAFTNLDAANLVISGDLSHTGNSATFGNGALSINAAGTDNNGLTVTGSSMSTSVAFDGTDYITVTNSSGSSITLNNNDGLMYLALDDGGVAAFYFSDSNNNTASTSDLVIAADATDNIYITTTNASWDLDDDDNRQSFTATVADPEVIYESEPEKDQVVFSDSCFIDGGATIVATTNFSTDDSFINLNASSSNNANFSQSGTGAIVFGYDQGGTSGSESKGGKIISHEGGYFEFTGLLTDEANATSTVAYQENASGDKRPVGAEYFSMDTIATLPASPLGGGTAIAAYNSNLYFYV